MRSVLQKHPRNVVSVWGELIILRFGVVCDLHLHNDHVEALVAPTRPNTCRQGSSLLKRSLDTCIRRHMDSLISTHRSALGGLVYAQ